MDPAAFFAPLVVIDISAKAAEDPDAVVTDGDLAEWEAVNGTIPDRAFVAMYSGWDAKVSDPEAYINLDSDNVQHFPGWSGQAVAFLTGERTVVGIGVDTPSLDPATRPTSWHISTRCRRVSLAWRTSPTWARCRRWER
jgi:kynurenine formamidase